MYFILYVFMLTQKINTHFDKRRKLNSNLFLIAEILSCGINKVADRNKDTLVLRITSVFKTIAYLLHCFVSE